MALQTRNLVMIPLSITNQQGIEEGNYLRWQFNPVLGFPQLGFKLYRRPHLLAYPQEITIEISDNILTLQQTCRMVSLRLRLDGGPGLIGGLFDNSTIVERSTGGVAGAEVNINLEADAIEEVVLPAGAVVLEAKGVLVSSDADKGWGGPLGGRQICLPVTDKAYLCIHAHVPDDWAEAASRLPPEIADQYGGKNFQDLRTQLLSIVTTGPQLPNLSSPAGTVPKIEISPYELVLLTSIDPNIARMLGLLWVDREVSSDESFDYKVVGYWPAETIKKTLVSGAVGWDAFNFAGFWYDLKNGLQSETLTIDPEANAKLVTNFRIIERGMLSYTTIKQAVQYKVAEKKNRTVEYGMNADLSSSVSTGAGYYAVVGWIGEKYVAINGKNNKLAKLVLEQADADKKTLAIGETWDLGDGYTLTAQSIDAKASPRQAWLVLSRDGNKLDDKIIDAASIAGTGTQGVYTYYAKSIAGETNVPIFVTYVDNVFASATSDKVQLKYTWLISNTIMELKPGDKIGIFKVDSISGPLTLKNDSSITLSRGSTVDLVGSMKFKVTDNDYLKFYPIILKTAQNIYGTRGAVYDASGPVVPLIGEVLDIGRGWKLNVDAIDAGQAWIRLKKDGILRGNKLLSIGDIYSIEQYNDSEYIFRVKITNISIEPAREVIELEVSFILIHEWICYNVGGATPVLPVPTGLKAFPLAGMTLTRKDGSIMDRRFLAGLQWDSPSGSENQFMKTAVFCHIQRQNPSGLIEWLTEKFPLKISEESLNAMPISSQGPMYYIDAPGPGRHKYRIAAIDIFGRMSQYTDWVEIELKPPQPPSPADVEAKFLDPDDPMLSGDEKTWINANNKPGLKVRWKWIESLRKQAPDVSAFRIHFQPGWLNVVQGKIDDIPVESGDILGLKSNYFNANAAIPENVFAGEKLQMNQVNYNIESSAQASDGKFIFSIKKPIPKIDDFAAIDEGIFKITNITEAGSDLKITINYQVPAQATIESFIGRIIKIDQREYKIVSCLKDPTGTYPIFTVSKIYPRKGDFFSIPLSKQSSALIDYRNASEWKQELHTEPLTSPTKEQYEIIIPDPPLHPDSDNMVVYGQIGIGSLNSEGEGSVSSPATVIAIYREKPPKQEVQDSLNMYATPANFYGKSSYALRWGKGSAMYFVYRAMDETVFAIDAELRQGTRSKNPNDYAEFLSNFPGYEDEVKNKIISPSSTDIDYKKITEDAHKNVLLKALANLPGNEKAFAKLHEKAIEPDDPKYANRNTEAPPPGQPEPAVDPSLLLYVDDTLDGRANNCYFYRIRTINENGTLGDFGLSTLPVNLPKVTPPIAPKITKIEGGNRQITIKWSTNPGADIVGYLVYRTDSERLAQDVRRMILIKNNPADSYSVSGDKTEFVDKSVEARKMYFYRAAAVSVINENGKQFENRSESSIMVTGQAYDLTPPDPPTITTIEWIRIGDDGKVYPYTEPIPPGQMRLRAVRLVWTSQDPQLVCLVQFRTDPTSSFDNASGWLPRGVYEFIHLNEYDYIPLEYRLKVVNYAGNANITYNPATIAPQP